MKSITTKQPLSQTYNTVLNVLWQILCWCVQLQKVWAHWKSFQHVMITEYSTKCIVIDIVLMYTVSLLTLTGDSSIFRVGTVMNAKWVTRTVHQSGLSPTALHIVKKNGSSSLTKVGKGPSNCTCAEKYIEWGNIPTKRHMQHCFIYHI